MRRVKALGCFIDGSHMKNTDFQIAVIQFAITRGFEIDTKQFEDDLLWLAKYEDSVEDDEDILLDIYDALDWTYDDALGYLNDIDFPAGRVWVVRDQSLFAEDTE